MSNIWIVLSGRIFLILLASGVIIYELKTKKKEYIIKTIFCLICIVFFIVISIPHLQDVIEQKTTIVIADYVRYEPAAKGSQRLYFISNSGEFSLEAPRVTRPVANLKEGKTYEIEYYNNTKIIKSYRLIE